MKPEYDLSKLKKLVTMRISEDIIGYFKDMSAESGVPYQHIINLYLRDCVLHRRQVDISWNDNKNS